MKKNKLWIVLSLILVFAAGFVGGIFGGRWFLSGRPEDRRSGGAAGYPSPDQWMKDLGLTAEQREKIHEIFKKNDVRIKELRTDFYKHLGEIRERLKQEIDAVLTPDQKRKMDAMIQKFIEQHRKDYEKRVAHSESPKKENPPKESRHEEENDRRSDNSGGYHRSHPGRRPF